MDRLGLTVEDWGSHRPIWTWTDWGLHFKVGEPHAYLCMDRLGLTLKGWRATGLSGHRQSGAHTSRLESHRPIWTWTAWGLFCKVGRATGLSGHGQTGAYTSMLGEPWVYLDMGRLGLTLRGWGSHRPFLTWAVWGSQLKVREPQAYLDMSSLGLTLQTWGRHSPIWTWTDCGSHFTVGRATGLSGHGQTGAHISRLGSHRPIWTWKEWSSHFKVGGATDLSGHGQRSGRATGQSGHGQTGDYTSWLGEPQAYLDMSSLGLTLQTWGSHRPIWTWTDWGSHFKVGGATGPNGWAMGCLFWIFVIRLTAL